MTDYARKLLDELMGPDRNQDRKTVKHFWDDDVCKDYLVDYCPNQLFLNTKSDLGICPLRHEEKMKDEYLESEEREKYRRRYEEDFYQHIQGLIRDLDRKIRRGNERINLKGDEETERQTQATKDERSEQIVMLEEKIKAIQVNIENCGEEGLVDEAQEYMRQVDTLTSQLNSLRSLEAREKKMEVCGICAALLVVNDAPERIAAHMSGKQHNGYQKIRETFEHLRSKRQASISEDRGRRQQPPVEDRRPSSYSRGSGDHYDRHDRNDRRPPPPSRDEGRYQREEYRRPPPPPHHDHHHHQYNGRSGYRGSNDYPPPPPSYSRGSGSRRSSRSRSPPPRRPSDHERGRYQQQRSRSPTLRY